MHLLIAQSAADISFEMARLQRNFTFLCYGLVVAWLILVVYVMMMASRERKLKRDHAKLQRSSK